MKPVTLLLVLLFAVSSFAGSRQSDTLGQDTESYKQNTREWKYEQIREFNELLVNDVDSLFDYTTGLTSTNVDKDTLEGVQQIELDASVGSNPGNASMYSCIKTSVVTIGHPGEATTDYAWTSAANSNEQSLGVDTVPVNARIIDVTMVCTEAVAGVTTDFTIDCGDGNGTDEFFTATDLKGAGAIIGGDASEAILLPALTTEIAIIVNANPNAEDWDAMTGGEFSVITTYIDIAAVK